MLNVAFGNSSIKKRTGFQNSRKDVEADEHRSPSSRLIIDNNIEKVKINWLGTNLTHAKQFFKYFGHDTCNIKTFFFKIYKFRKKIAPNERRWNEVNND